MTRVAITTAICALLAAPALGQEGEGVRGQWSMSVKGGVTPDIDGALHLGGTGLVLGLPTSVESRDFADVYNNGFRVRAGLGYGVSRHAEVVGDFTYGRSEAEPISVGDVASLDLRADFADYQDWGLEGGVRWHFAPDAAVNPYVAGVAGFRWIDAIPSTFTVPAANVVLPDTLFYDETIVPTFGGDFGVVFAVTPRIGLGVEAGLRWTGEPDGLDEDLAGTGLENLNDTGSRWTMPIVGTFRVRF